MHYMGHKNGNEDDKRFVERKLYRLLFSGSILHVKPSTELDLKQELGNVQDNIYHAMEKIV